MNSAKTKQRIIVITKPKPMATCLPAVDDVNDISTKLCKNIRSLFIKHKIQLKKEILDYVFYQMIFSRSTVTFTISKDHKDYSIRYGISEEWFMSYDFSSKIISELFTSVESSHMITTVIKPYVNLNIDEIVSYLRFKCKCAGFLFHTENRYGYYHIEISKPKIMIKRQRHPSTLRSVVRGVMFINMLLKLTYTPGHYGAERALKRLKLNSGQ